nr:hypothetical protein OH837_48220 [Streptomyces canus]
MKDATGEDLAGWAAVQSPCLSGFQFTLLPLNPLLRREVLYALVQRDAQRPTLSPVAVRLLARGLEGVDSIAALPPKQLADLGYIDRNCEAHWNDVLRLVRAAFDKFRGIDPLDKPCGSSPTWVCARAPAPGCVRSRGSWTLR